MQAITKRWDNAVAAAARHVCSRIKHAAMLMIYMTVSVTKSYFIVDKKQSINTAPSTDDDSSTLLIRFKQQGLMYSKSLKVY